MFQITYSSNDTGNLSVVPASSKFFASEGENLKALLVGTGSVIALSQEGDAVDVTSVTVAPIESIQIANLESISFRGQTATLGTSAIYGGTPMGSVGALAGTVDFEWTSSDPSVVEIETSSGESGSPTVSVNFIKEGTATLTAFTSTAEGSITIRVGST